MTKKRTCDTCEAEKAESQFRPAGRGRKRTCIACEGGEQLGNGRAAEPTPVKLTGSLEVHAGYGFRAAVEDGRLVIEQDAQAEDGSVQTANVTLAPHEVRRLFDWAESLLGKELAA